MLLLELQQLNKTLAHTNIKLVERENGLCLEHPDFTPLIINFLDEKLQYRSSHGALGEMVAKACSAKLKPTVLDLTAGLGRDSYLLASLGCKVKMVERNPIMFALLNDALKRLKSTSAELDLELIFADSKTLLASTDENIKADVVYVDPMHPHRTKSALVKKEMRILREVVGEDLDKNDLLKVALRLANKRVVVKWPLKAKLDLDIKPSGSFKGKSTRFDIYSPQL